LLFVPQLKLVRWPLLHLALRSGNCQVLQHPIDVPTYSESVIASINQYAILW